VYHTEENEQAFFHHEDCTVFLEQKNIVLYSRRPWHDKKQWRKAINR
jgi:hypothetical protein